MVLRWAFTYTSPWLSQLSPVFSLTFTYTSPSLFSMCRQSPPPLSHFIPLHLLVSWLTITRFSAIKSFPMVCAFSQHKSKVSFLDPFPKPLGFLYHLVKIALWCCGFCSWELFYWVCWDIRDLIGGFQVNEVKWMYCLAIMWVGFSEKSIEFLIYMGDWG